MMSQQAVENEDVSMQHEGAAVGGATDTLEVRNLRDEAGMLYEDCITINQKLDAERLQNQSLNDELTKVKDELNGAKELTNGLNEENVQLKKKLAEYTGMKSCYDEAIDKLSKSMIEVDLLKTLQQRSEVEAREFQEQAQNLTRENEDLMERCREAERLTVKTNEKNQNLQTKVDTLSAIYDMQERALRQERSRRQKLERQLQTLSKSSSPEDDSIMDIRNSRFHLIQTSSAMECRRCHQRNDLISNHKCSYHSSQPIPPQTWRILFPEQQSCQQPDHFYWPCCNQFSRIEPEGCHITDHHDFL